MAVENALAWMNACHDKNQIRFIFGVNSYDHCAKILHRKDMFGSKIQVQVESNARVGVCDTVTKMSRHADGDIVVLSSDDFIAPVGWDSHLYLQFVNFDGALIVNDGYKIGTNIIPLPVVSKSFLKKLNGIMYHPAYYHYYSDQELFDVVTSLGEFKDLRGSGSPQFNHIHWSFRGGRKKDEFDVRNNTRWGEDKRMYEKRKTLSVKEKLKL